MAEPRHLRADRDDDPTMLGRAASRLRRLSKLDEYEIADGEPDIRRWRVFDRNGDPVGVVHDLIVDMGDREVRYMDVALDERFAGAGDPDDAHVLVPVGTARLSDDVEAVTLTTTDGERLAALPRYDHTPITRDRECELQGALAGQDGPVEDTGARFYEHPSYDTAVFWGARRAPGGTSYVIATENFHGHKPQR